MKGGGDDFEKNVLRAYLCQKKNFKHATTAGKRVHARSLSQKSTLYKKENMNILVLRKNSPSASKG